jgi:UDP-N-acetylglucosamine 2-epimerase
MAGAFFAELGLARPDYSLGIGGGSHAEQTGRMLVSLEPIVAAETPDAVLVYGDTNSTLAGALAAAKLNVPVAHVEAGLRSFDRGMPEELNRIVADHLATWCFAPTATAVANLRAEGIVSGVTLVGDLMHDLVAHVAAEVREPTVLTGVMRDLASQAPGLHLSPGRYVFATVHRAENRTAIAARQWVELLGVVARPERPVVLALHPGTKEVIEEARIAWPADVRVVAPQGYRTSLALQLHAAAVITDSGGMQRESGWLGTPCLVLRSATEWVEAMEVAAGGMVLVGLDRARAVSELTRLAPLARGPDLATARAERLDLRANGTATAIEAVLSGTQ